jgi:hypothetical protein
VCIEMEETFARVSRAGNVVCGRQHADGGFYCDEPLAAIVKVHSPPSYPERLLAALPGWRLDRKGILRRTTSVEDKRAHGRSASKAAHGQLLELPVIVFCPKCAVLQWLDAERLSVGPRPGTAPAAASRWAIRA